MKRRLLHPHAVLPLVLSFAAMACAGAPQPLQSATPATPTSPAATHTAQPAAPEPPAAPLQGKAAAIDRLVQTYARLGQFHGTALVAEQGKVLYRQASGTAVLEWGTPNTLDTKFLIASVTKPFTATLVMQLVQEGKLQLEGKLGAYLPEFARTPAAKVTVHQLLSHTSGLSSPVNGNPDFWPGEGRRSYTVAEFVRAHIKGNLDHDPGTRWAYNNAGYYLLGVLIERVTGHEYEQELRTRILTPSGMTQTGLAREGAILPRAAFGYSKELGEIIAAPYVNPSSYYASGGLYATVDDLYLWDRALAAGKLVSPETLRRMATPVMQDYGYGWDLKPWQVGKSGKTLPVMMHSGNVFGFSSLVVRSTSDDALIVLLDNMSEGDTLPGLGQGIFDILHGETPAEPKQRLADVLGPVLRQHGVEAVEREIQRLKREAPDTCDLGERSMNSFGYQLLHRKRVDAAIRIFQLNVEAFPKSGNVYDSLGEAYQIRGDKALAIANYRKSLELDPANTNAEIKLKELGARR